MNQTLTPQQIKNILIGIRETLQLVQNNPGYQKIANSDTFHTSNDLVLGDAIQSIDDVYQGIIDWEFTQS
jgi:hypothetical protein